MSGALVTLTNKLAARFDMESNGQELFNTLKATVFKGNVSDAQMTALLIVANQYTLNPWTKEIYAFPDKNNGIVPVVGVDGWSRIINDNPAFNGMEFTYSDEQVTMPGAKPCPAWCEVTIYRKDRERPIVVREYLDEVYQAARGNFSGPWQTHTKRFLRHKTLIQGSRLAFGFAGIYDQDEAERIVSPEPIPADLDLSGIQNAATMDELQAAFSAAWKSTTDAAARKAMTEAKDRKKKELQDAPIDVDPETGEVVNHV